MEAKMDKTINIDDLKQMCGSDKQEYVQHKETKRHNKNIKQDVGVDLGDFVHSYTKENGQDDRVIKEEGQLHDEEALFCGSTTDWDLKNFSESLQSGLDLEDLYQKQDGQKESAIHEQQSENSRVDIDVDVDLDDDDTDEEEHSNLIRSQLLYLIKEMFALDKFYYKKPLSVLNKEAAAFQKSGDNLSSIAAYAKLFAKVKRNNLTHPELHVTHCNRASAYLNLGLYEEALWDSMKSIFLAQKAILKNTTGLSSYVKAHAKKGFALLGLKRFREASITFNEGLELDPFHEDMKHGLEEAQQKILEDILQGKSLHIKALPGIKEKQKITMQPFSTPLHRIRTDDMLPMQLLTPFQAENDYHVKDTYNYMTVQTDIRMPKFHFTYLEDEYRQSRFEQAICKAVKDISEDKDCRVLNLGAGSGLHAMMCLRAGAYHVTAVERWLYLAMSCKEVLLANGFNDDQVKVVYKRPTDLALLRDVPISCNLLLCDILDDGLLTSGFIPAVRHALNNVMIDQPVVIPCSATLYVQAGQVYTGDVCGFDMSQMNRHRWMPAFTSGIPLCNDSFIPLSNPVEVWQFDMLTPPEEGSHKLLDLEFLRSGTFNAVRFWYDLHLYDDVHLSTGPESVSVGLKSLRPAVQYLVGQVKVEEGYVLPLTASHNTVRVRFDLEDAEYMNLTRPDASFPQIQFSMLNDRKRNEAYYRAIERVIQKMKSENKEVHALDMGCGSGILSMMAARCGADSVVASELHDTLSTTARHVIAQNNLSNKVTVLNKDVGLLERGKHVRTKGANLVIADFFDSGLLHDNFLFLLEKAKANVLQSDHTIVPAAATIYCMGIEAHTSSIKGFDFSSFNKYRWDKSYESLDLEQLPHRKLTKPKKVFEYFFCGDKKGRNRENVLKLEVVNSGYLNAVVFWFDLHLDDQETITTAPHGIDISGNIIEAYSENLAIEVDENTIPNDFEGFIPSKAFEGERKGYVFKNGMNGIGYYVDSPINHVMDKNQALVTVDESAEREPCHYWGQSLQYLERGVSVQVQAKKKVTLLAKREANTIKFTLKEGVGNFVAKSPWKVEWGGGASVENPHFQRVHYCELLVREFLMRVRCKRFPPIEKDMKMMLANCGNLLLDPTVISEVYHEFVILEMIHSQPEFCPGASLEALTKIPLQYC